MQRNPEELYELGPAAPGLAGAPMLHYLEGFIDAGTAGRLLAEHLLRTFSHETVARFDTDRLIDYRSRRPLMTYDNSHWESYETPELALHLLHDQGGRAFLLLTGPEPDHEWDLFTKAVLGIAARLDTGPAMPSTARLNRSHSWSGSGPVSSRNGRSPWSCSRCRTSSGGS